jgi:GNAT superfamily N-acetyltransferase
MVHAAAPGAMQWLALALATLGAALAAGYAAGLLPQARQRRGGDRASKALELRDKRGRRVVVHRLKDTMALIPQISERLFPEFEDFNRKIGITNADEYSGMLRQRCHTDKLPQTLVMTDEGGGTLLSCGALDDDDLEYGKYSECSPWVADLYTLEAERGCGLAGIILDAIVELAASRSFEAVYLWTEHPEIYKFYEGRGFAMLEEREYLGKTIGVFCKPLGVMS